MFLQYVIQSQYVLYYHIYLFYYELYAVLYL